MEGKGIPPMFSSPEPKAKHPCEKGIQFWFKWRPLPFSKGDNYEISKIHWQIKKPFLQNCWANFNQTWHKSTVGEGNSSLFKWRPPSLSKGEIITKLRKYIDKFYKLNQTWVKGIQVCSNEGPIFFQGEIITKLRKYINEFVKPSSPEPLGQFQPNSHNSSLGEGDSSLFKWMAPPFSKGR